MLSRHWDVFKNLTPDDFYDLFESLSEGQIRMAWFIQHGAPPHTEYDNTIQGRQQKNFQGGGSQRKKDRKNSTIMPHPGGEVTEKSPKNNKKTPKNSTI